MGHVPHVHLPAPWPDALIPLAEPLRRHLRAVLRLTDHSPVSYTDGRGRTGMGSLVGDDILRGDEAVVTAVRPSIVLAVAAPQSTDRARFVVEKAAELAVTELRWLTTRFSGPRVPRREKAAAWAVGALEQSRGAHLMQIGAPLRVDELPAVDVDLVLVADPAGARIAATLAERDPKRVAIAIGPEGGFESGEVPGDLARVRLGDRLLRVETAAIVAVAAVRIR